jgi:hypothetical protein
VFWSAPLAVDSDFTPEDPLALVTPPNLLGLWLFRGITTRTSRAQTQVGRRQVEVGAEVDGGDASALGLGEGL